MLTRTLLALTASVLLAAVAFLPAPPAARAADPQRDLQAWEFPREFGVAGRTLALSEPIVLSRDPGTGAVALRFAARVTDPLGRPFWGSVDAEGVSHVDLNGRFLYVDGLKVVKALQPQLPDTDRDQVLAALPDVFPKTLLLRLDVLTAAPWAQPKEPVSQGKVALSAPEILVRTSPAALVQVDGDPVFQPVGEFPIEFLVNSSTNVFRDPKAGTHWLLADGRWLQSKSLEGPWEPLAGKLPVLLTQMPANHPRGHVRRWIPGTDEFTKKKTVVPTGPAPEILVRKAPAELVLLLGEPLLTWIPGTKLMTVANTESDLFFHPKSNAYFLCVAGRWVQAEDVAGPWKETFNVLPEDFRGIPRDHARGHVLACVPGTPEAAEATVRAQLADRILLARAVAMEVAFEGKEPQTVALEGTKIEYATNTEDDLFRLDGSWWVCARGVWLTSQDLRSWKPAIDAPAAFADLPETSGFGHLRGVKTLGNAEKGLRFSVDGRWSGVFVANGTVLHGSGYARRGLLRNGNWYPGPRTFGDGRWWDPITGVFQPRSVRYGADGRATADEWSPWTASYGRVRQFADRYSQGGRRMFHWIDAELRFDDTATRPDPYGGWGTSILERDGVPSPKFPLGDRTNEAPFHDVPVYADATGVVWRNGAAGPETWDGKAWVAKADLAEEGKVWLAVLDRLHRRPEETRRWVARRAAPLPVNAIR